MASRSTGSTCSSMNSRTRSSSASTRSDGAKSMVEEPTCRAASDALEGEPRDERGERPAAGDPGREHERARAAGVASGGRHVGLKEHLARGLRAGLGHEYVARPGREEVRHVEAGAAAQNARHAPLEEKALD